MISDLERERASRRLQAACVAGQLTLEDFSARIERAMAASTRAELSAVVDDLVVPEAPVPVVSRSRSTIVLSSVERTGAWRLTEHTALLVVLGSCKLDLRHARITARETIIHVRIVGGSLEVILPRGVEADVEASTFLSSKALRLLGPSGMPDAPRVVVRGVVVGGSLTLRNEGHIDLLG